MKAAGAIVPQTKGASGAKDATIETLRGLACILVVLYHVRGSDPSHGLRLQHDNPWSYLVDSVVYVRMPLFTFLSGFVYALRPLRGGYGSFLHGKYRRVIVPMLVIGTAFGLLQLLVPGTNVKAVVPWYLWHIFPIGHFWFLESIFAVFAVVGLLDLYGLLKRARWCLVLMSAALVADAALPVWPNILGLRMSLYLLPFFLAGLAATRFDWRSAKPWMKISAVVGAVLLLSVTQLGLLGLIHKVPERHSVTAGVLGILACLVLLLNNRCVRWLAYIGGFSFTIYTCHVFGTAAARMALNRVGMDSVGLHMLAGVVAGVLLGIAVELAARRTRVGRALILGQRRSVMTRRSSAGQEVKAV
ncbi:acyltransferase [Paenarthrobacter sp. Z7-10]|uniref:acyltransferase family protein n=1 Tax=Paenarthrobacter sp. Z7-10 TaxID=2787635 RepID=UPI0022A972ED|nr:acyltransferase [Paenarthrobacter sp. Z7-10]MCZ2402939.1 acyltransferase [Paenarthrobacter sp. Z7-10]